ncbi:MAG: hypothetical protein HQK83_11205 [Fibrobacteria bacterium]|nr:hypothetical protein [Fibrobacteria bacterium]
MTDWSVPTPNPLISEYIDKWIAIGKSTEPADRPRAEKAVINFYKQAGFDEPEIVWTPCPVSGCLLNIVLSSVADRPSEVLSVSVLKSVIDPVHKANQPEVINDIRRAVVTEFDPFRPVMDNIIRKMLHEGISSGQFRNMDGADIKDFLTMVFSSANSVIVNALQSFKIPSNNSGKPEYNPSPFFYGGSFWSCYAAGADYAHQVHGLNINHNALELAQSCGYYWLLKNIAILTDRPCRLELKSGRLHCESDMALKYRSGWGVCYLNGIEVKKEYVLSDVHNTPAEDLFKMVLKEENIDIRRELLQMIGVERFKNYGTLIHKKNNYELINMSGLFAGIDYAPYLLMKNPSLGIFHMEGVSPECENVQEALNWRKYKDINKEWKPEILT